MPHRRNTHFRAFCKANFIPLAIKKLMIFANMTGGSAGTDLAASSSVSTKLRQCRDVTPVTPVSLSVWACNWWLTYGNMLCGDMQLDWLGAYSLVVDPNAQAVGSGYECHVGQNPLVKNCLDLHGSSVGQNLLVKNCLNLHGSSVGQNLLVKNCLDLHGSPVGQNLWCNHDWRHKCIIIVYVDGEGDDFHVSDITPARVLDIGTGQKHGRRAIAAGGVHGSVTGCKNGPYCRLIAVLLRKARGRCTHTAVRVQLEFADDSDGPFP